MDALVVFRIALSAISVIGGFYFLTAKGFGSTHKNSDVGAGYVALGIAGIMAGVANIIMACGFP